MKKKILVTGGTGFIGSALVRSLVAAGARVRSFDNDSRGHAGRLGAVAEKVERIVGDIRDGRAVADAIRGVDAVAHLASVNGTELFYAQPDLVLEVAVKGMMNVLDGCLLHGVKELTLASSSEVYQTPTKIPTDESAALCVPDPLNARFSYSGGKIISELLALNYGRKSFDRVTVLRPHNVYGPDMGWEHVVPQLALRVHDLAVAQPSGVLRVPMQGSGTETRAFIHVSDAVAGIHRVMESGAHLGIYHLGTMREVPVAWLVRQIGSALGRDVDPAPGTLMEGSPRRRCPDVHKLMQLGWHPHIELEQGIAETVAWYAAHAAHRPQAGGSKR